MIRKLVGGMRKCLGPDGKMQKNTWVGPVLCGQPTAYG